MTKAPRVVEHVGASKAKRRLWLGAVEWGKPHALADWGWAGTYRACLLLRLRCYALLLEGVASIGVDTELVSRARASVADVETKGEALLVLGADA